MGAVRTKEDGDFASAARPMRVVCCTLKRHWLVNHGCDEQVILLSEKGLEKCNQKPSKKKKKKLSRRQLFAAYCIFIMQEQRGSGRSMLCQSVLKHLRHSSSVMKSVEKRGIWQNVVRTLFYHKCFVSQSFLQRCSLTRNYKSVWIFDGRRKLFLSLLRAWDKLRFLIR